MDRTIYDNYVKILRKELVPALGCTEPIALAYASAKAREVLGEFPEHMTVWCSGNIIKNVKGVKVPNSGGMKGVEAAAVLGLAGGDPSQALGVLEAVTQTDIKRTKELLRESFCDCCLKEGVANLYIEVQVVNGENEATVIIEQEHTNITRIEKNGKIVYAHKKEVSGEEIEVDKSLLNLADILVFAKEVDLNEVRDVLARQIRYNSRIAKEGLEHEWGAQVGRVIAEEFGTTVQWKAVASAAAGSDARMSGCSLPVIINSGSGNQGMTCSLPVIEYGKELKKSEEEIYRALCVSNLVALNQKRYIGSLSAYCGAVCAAAGAGAGITYLCGGNLEQIQNTVVNTIADAGGIVCDGAKPSCAAKIATSLQAAILSHKMAMRGLWQWRRACHGLPGRYDQGGRICWKSGNEADRCRNPESYDRKDKNRRYRKIRERSASCKKGLIFVSKRKTDETDSTDSFTGIDVHLSGTLCLDIGSSHFCGKLLWPCHCPRVFLLCSLVYSVTVIAGS